MSSIDIPNIHTAAADMTARDKDTSPSPTRRKPKLMAPQDAIDDFWARFVSKTPGKGELITFHFSLCMNASLTMLKLRL